MKCYFGIYFVIVLLRYLGIYQLETEFKDWWWIIPQIIDIIGLVLYIIVACKNPGNIEVNYKNRIQYMKLLENVDPADLCVMCQTIKTSSARHCYECGHCVEHFDHHCPWLNTCIGLTNHNIYFFYLWFMFLSCITMIAQSIW